MNSPVALFVIFVGGPLVWWWLRRSKVGPAAPLRIVGRSALTRSSVVALIEAGDRRFLVGATDQGITLLSEVPVGAPATAQVAVEADSQSADYNQTIDDTDSVVASLAVTPLGPRMSPLETLRAMTVRTTPTHSRASHARRR